MDQTNAQVTDIERRRKPRINCQYSATVHGQDAKGKKFEDSAKLANLSATGLFMWINSDIQQGQKIFVIVRLNSELVKEATPRIATNGVVTRIEPQPDGVMGVAIKFQRYRFL
jgi:c-di-GMP-binding flagellar brake protein YcgR